jgi:hypothetical protein
MAGVIGRWHNVSMNHESRFDSFIHLVQRVAQLALHLLDHGADVDHVAGVRGQPLLRLVPSDT